MEDNNLIFRYCPKNNSTEQFKIILDLYRMQEFCDVTLHLGDQSFQCHRVVLAAGSGFFKTMFLSELEKMKCSSEVTLPVELFDSGSFENVLSGMED